MVVANYLVKYRQWAANDEDLGFVDVVDVIKRRCASHVPYIVGELAIDIGKYGSPRHLITMPVGDTDEHAMLCCNRGYLDLEPSDLYDIDLLLAGDFVDAMWLPDDWRNIGERVKLPVKWIEHKVRRSPWSDVLVDSGQEDES